MKAEQSLESQLKMARSRRSEVKRVPLTPEEKEFIGKIMDKAVAAEKAGKLKEALDLYTDYKNELMKINDKLQEERKKEINRIKEKKHEEIIDNIKTLYKREMILDYLIRRYTMAKAKAKADDPQHWQEEINFVVNQKELVLDSMAEIGGLRKFRRILIDKYNVEKDNSLDFFNLPEESLKIIEILNDENLSEKSFERFEMDIKPEIEKDLEESIKKDKKAQKYIKELMKTEKASFMPEKL